MQRYFLSAALLGAALLSGCATMQQPPAAAGPKPSLDEAQEVIAAYLQETLKDPYTVKDFAVIDGPRHACWRGTQAGWIVQYRYNARNSYGAYTGLKNHIAALRDDRGLYMVRNLGNARLDYTCPEKG